MATSNPSSSVPQSFPNLIAEKLDDSNYLHWKQQIELVIKSHKLQRFVINPSIPQRYLTDEDRVANKVNPAYEAWEVQDQTLLTWLQSTLSKSVLSRVIGSIHSHQVWDKIHEYFHVQKKARAQSSSNKNVTRDSQHHLLTVNVKLWLGGLTLHDFRK